MEEGAGRSGWTADVARVLTGAAGWAALAAFVSPWSREQGAAEVGFSGLAGVHGLGAVDVQGRGLSWLDTVHWVDAWLVLSAGLVLWVAASSWRRRPARLVAAATSGLLLILGTVAAVLHLVPPGQGATWYGPYLAIVAGLAGLAGGLLDRRSAPTVGPARPAETRIRDALVDFDLDRHATPRLLRMVRAVLVTAAVGAYLVTVVGTLFDELTAAAEPPWLRVLSAVAALALASLALGVVLVVLRVAVEFLVVPFRIVDAVQPTVPAAPARTEADRDVAAPPEPDPTHVSEPESEPGAAPAPQPARPAPPRPSVKVHGTEDQWYRREPSDGSEQALPEARGIPEHEEERHPLRRTRRESPDDGSGGPTSRRDS